VKSLAVYSGFHICLGEKKQYLQLWLTNFYQKPRKESQHSIKSQMLFIQQACKLNAS